MVLTRNFRKTVQARAKRDPAYREAMLTEAVDSFLSGDVEVGKAMLRDYINATIGFEAFRSFYFSAPHRKVKTKITLCAVNFAQRAR